MTLTMRATHWGRLERTVEWSVGLCALVAGWALCQGIGLPGPLTLGAMAVVAVLLSPLPDRAGADPAAWATAVLTAVLLLASVAVLAVLAAGWAGLAPLAVVAAGVSGLAAVGVAGADAARRIAVRLR